MGLIVGLIFVQLRFFALTVFASETDDLLRVKQQLTYTRTGSSEEHYSELDDPRMNFHPEKPEKNGAKSSL